MAEGTNHHGRAAARRRDTRLGLLAAALTIATIGCSAQRFPSVDVKPLLAAEINVTMQERLVILGVDNCPATAQLGVLLDPDTVVTPTRIVEPDDLVRANTITGEKRQVGQPTIHRSIIDDSYGPIVHYGLKKRFGGAPTSPIASVNPLNDTKSATLAWVSRGELKTRQAPVIATSSPPTIQIDRSFLSFDVRAPVAVIDSMIGVVGWLAAEPESGTEDHYAILPLDGQPAGLDLPLTRYTTCKAAEIASIAADPSLGTVELPDLPAGAGTPGAVASPAASSINLTTADTDILGAPCPTGEVTATFDSYTVTEPAPEPGGIWRMSASLTITNNTTVNVFSRGIAVHFVTSKGDETVHTGVVLVAPGEAKQVSLDAHVGAPLEEIKPVDLANSGMNYEGGAYGCN